MTPVDRVAPRLERRQLRCLALREAEYPPHAGVEREEVVGRVAEALRLGATDYLPKPVDADMLLHKVQSVLGEPTQSPFHWARFPRLLSMTVGEHAAVGTSICESGLIVELPDGATLTVGDVVPLESAFF